MNPTLILIGWSDPILLEMIQKVKNSLTTDENIFEFSRPGTYQIGIVGRVGV